VIALKGFGVNTRRTDGSFDEFEKQLAYLKRAGFEYLEVSADVVDTIAGGRIVERKLDKLVEILSRYEFKHTAHIQNEVDLRDVEDWDFQIASFKAGIEFAGRIGAELVVFHFERNSRDPDREALFRHSVLEGLEHATRWSLKLGIENIEIERLSTVVEFVQEIDDPNLLLVLDVGHAYLSEQYFGEDFFQSLSKAAAFTGHIHLSDNFGRFERMRLENFELYRVFSYTNRLNLGRGDLNLPPGWGTIPFEKILPLFHGYGGIVILEYYHDKYIDFNSDILKDTKQLIENSLNAS
jgi:sugar phosphate isomerase/epimerase